MADITEVEQWDTGVYQLETTDPVQGGVDGIDNLPHKHLANRTLWLKQNKADKNGDNTQTFKVADAIEDDDAVNKKKLDEAVNNSIDFFKPKTNQALFEKVTAYSIKIPSGFVVNVGTTLIRLESDYIINLNTNLDIGSKVGGTDYYIYALKNGSFVISANASYPYASNENDSRKIGGFHYGLIPEDFASRGNITASDATNIAGINKYSFWDLKWRPVSNPEGMVYIGGKWYDIYLLNADHIVNGTSKAGVTIAGGTLSNGRAYPKIPLEFGGDGSANYGALKWFHACEIAKANAKQLISYSEFMTIAYGTTEGESAGDSDNGTTKHLNKFVSKFGIEQATGVQWIWGADVGGNRSENSTTWAWRDKAEGRGQIYALHDNHITAVMLGGSRGHGVNAGSRASLWSNYVWVSRWDIGCRFACDHLRLV